VVRRGERKEGDEMRDERVGEGPEKRESIYAWPTVREGGRPRRGRPFEWVRGMFKESRISGCLWVRLLSPIKSIFLVCVSTG
jgi:hypothetical protein